MKTKHSSTDGNKKQGHSHTKHMWMMAICCGLPIIGFLVIGVIGISMPSLQTLLLIICPIGMIGMMYIMHRDGQAKDSACCDSKKPAEGSGVESAQQVIEDSQQAGSKPKKPGSLEA